MAGLSRIRLRRRVSPGPSRRFIAWYLQQSDTPFRDQPDPNNSVCEGVFRDGVWYDGCVWVDGVPFPTQRYVTTLDPAGGMHYSVPRTVIPAGADFEWEFELASNGDVFHVFADNTNFNRLAINGANWIGQFVATSSSGNAWRNDGKSHKLKFTRVSSDWRLHVDGVLDSQVNRNVEITFNVIGGKFGGTTTATTFNGSFFSSKLIVPSNPELNHDYRFIDNDGVLVNYAKPLGSELIDNPTFSNTHAGWSLSGGDSVSATVDGDTLVLTQTAPYASAQQVIDVVPGETYLFTGELFGDTGYYQIRDRSTSVQLLNLLSTTRQVVSGVFTATGNQIFLRCHGSGTQSVTMRFRSPSLKQAGGYGQAVNVTAANRELMTFDSGRVAWVGRELWIENLVVTTGGNPWVINGDGSYTRNSGAAFGQLYLNNPPIISGAEYIVSFNVTQMTGALRVITRNASGINIQGSVSAVGFFEFKVTAEDNFNGYIWFDTDSAGSSATINTVSLKRIIEVSQ